MCINSSLKVNNFVKMDTAPSESELFPEYFITTDGNVVKEKVTEKGIERSKKHTKSLITHFLNIGAKRMPVSVDKIGNLLRAGRVVRLSSPTKGYEVTKSVNDLITKEKSVKYPKDIIATASEELDMSTLTALFQKSGDSRRKSRIPEMAPIKKPEIVYEEEKEEIIKIINVPAPRLDGLRRSISVTSFSKPRTRYHSKTFSSGLESTIPSNKTDIGFFDQEKKIIEKKRPSSTGNFMRPTFSSTSAYVTSLNKLLPKINRSLTKEELINKLPKKLSRKRGYTRRKSIELLRTLKMIHIYKGENSKIDIENSKDK
ncbi:unnamed protein product [Blepharisma stoltei]|uniref:Uncharacterized protein n=1 Tax=Blepharisma stoltei TaxID=1481888 RepID=A0AAU9KEH2_9CILI|nr:unnamed protein product [Blepharisma stoltei]